MNEQHQPAWSLLNQSDDSEHLTEKIDTGKRRLFITGNGISTTNLESETVKEPMLTEVIVDFIRQSSKSGHLLTCDTFLAAPHSILDEQLTASFNEIATDERFADIAIAVGTKNNYCYSTTTMSTNYANIQMLTEEQDICKTIAEAVRFECKTYPRPYKVEMLTFAPYNFSQQEITTALIAITQQTNYSDICQIESSNQQPYLYSDRFMSYGKAYGLCEWLEIEQYENP